ESHDGHQECADGKGTIAEHAQINDRVICFQLANEKSDQPYRGQQRQRDDKARAEPIFFLAFVEHNLETADSKHKQADAPVINAHGFSAQIRRVENIQLSKQESDDSDRNVDVEDPAPAIVIG